MVTHSSSLAFSHSSFLDAVSACNPGTISPMISKQRLLAQVGTPAQKSIASSVLQWLEINSVTTPSKHQAPCDSVPEVHMSRDLSMSPWVRLLISLPMPL